MNNSVNIALQVLPVHIRKGKVVTIQEKMEKYRQDLLRQRGRFFSCEHDPARGKDVLQLSHEH